jgi:hypothetical protein
MESIPIMNITRALIIRKEHLTNIFDNEKVWEMRSTKTNVRGRIGLIEAGSGLIVGETFLVDCLDPMKVDKSKYAMHLHQVTDLNLLIKWNTPWVLEGSFRYKFPIPYKHHAGAVIWVKL